MADGGLAFAQTNEVYVAQTGETNRICIDSNGNVVGGDADALRLTQDGLGNVIAIDQSGFGNKVATNSRDGVRPSLGIVEIRHRPERRPQPDYHRADQ